MNQIKFWHLAGWSKARQSYLGGIVPSLVGKQQISTRLVGWGEISRFLWIHQLSLPHVLYTPTTFTTFTV